MREQFVRIAMARLRSIYPFKPQRSAVAARMWVTYLERSAAKQWNDYTSSDPISDLEAAKAEILGNTGMEANTLVLQAQAHWL